MKIDLGSFEQTYPNTLHRKVKLIWDLTHDLRKRNKAISIAAFTARQSLGGSVGAGANSLGDLGAGAPVISENCRQLAAVSTSSNIPLH